MTEWSDLIEQSFGQQKQSAQALTVAGIDASPDDAARAMDLAQSSGVPANVIYPNLEAFERMHKSAMASAIVQQNPQLQDWLNQNPLNAKLANDDYGNLDEISQHLNKLSSGKSILQTGMDVWSRQRSIAGQQARAVGSGFVEGFGLGGPGQWMLQRPEDVEFLENHEWAKPLFAAAALVGAPVELSFRAIGGLFGAAKATAKETHKQLFGSDDAAGRFSNDLDLLAQFALLHAGGAMGTPRVPPELNQLARQARRTADSVGPYIRAGVEPPPHVDPVIDQVKAAQAKLDMEILDDLATASNSSSTRERNPESYRDYLAGHTNARLGISAEAIARLYGEKRPEPDDGILGWIPNLQDQLRVQSVAGGDVEVGVSDWLAKADPEVARELHDFIRVRPAGLNLEEAGEGAKPTELKEEPFEQGKAMLSQTLDQFDTGRRNAWVEVPEAGESGQGMYLRQAPGRDGQKGLTIANLRFEAKGTGAFTAYLDHLEQEAKRRGYSHVEVENIENPRLATFLQHRQGYRVSDMNAGMPSMIKYTREIQDRSTRFEPRAAELETPDRNLSTAEAARGRDNEADLLQGRIRQIDYDMSLARQRGEDTSGEGYAGPRNEKRAIRDRLREIGALAPLKAVRKSGGLEPLASRLKLETEDQGTTRRISMMDEAGNTMGNITATLEDGGKTVYIDHIASPQGARSLGHAAMRSALEQLKAMFPEAEKVKGIRVSGAREETYKTHGDVEIPLRAGEFADEDIASLLRAFEDQGEPDTGQWHQISGEIEAYVQPKELWTKNELAIHDAVSKVLEKIVPRLVDYMGAQEVKLRGRRVSGAYQMFKGEAPIIVWALGPRDAVQVARHEAIHHLRGNGFFTNDEWVTLEQAALDGDWKGKHDIGRRYADAPPEIQLEEAIAEEFSKWQGTKADLGPVQAIFEKIKGLLEAVKQAIGKVLGHEPSYEELFSKVESGEIGSRRGVRPHQEGIYLDPRAARDEQFELPGMTRLEDRDLFAKANSIGMTVKQYQRYQELIAKRDAEDMEYAAKQNLKNIERRQTEEWRTAEKGLRQEIKPEYQNRPDIQADDFLREGVLYGEKLQGRPRLDASRLTPEQIAALPKDYVAKTGGMHPDDVAGLFGFQSGAAMVERLAMMLQQRGEMGPKEYINHLTDTEVERRMQLEHGDLAQNILAEAKDHVISQTQFDLLHEETLGLATKAGVEMSMTQAAMKKAVAAEVGKLPLTQMNLDKLLAQAARAGNNAEKSLLAEEPKDAFKYKQQQYISILMANEAKKIEKETTRFDRNAKLMERREVPSVQQEYTNRIHDILVRLGKPVKRSVQDIADTISKDGFGSFEDFVNFKEQHDMREVPVAEFLLDPNWKKDFSALTVEEFRAVNDSIKALLANGRNEKKIYKAGEAADLAAIKGELIGELKTFPERKRDMSKDERKTFRYAFRTFLANHLQIESLFNRWDRGDPQGNWTQYVMRDLATAANDENARERRFAQKVRDLADDTDLSEKIDNKIFYDPTTFDRDPESGKLGPGENSVLLSLTRKNLRAILQNAGNDSNLEKLARGYGLEPAFVRAWLRKHATKADWDWAQKQGDIFAELKRESDQMYRNLTDIEPEGIEITPIDTPHGTYPGWYHPVVYDPVWEGASKKLIGGEPLEQDNYVRATTPAGYTKKRTGYTAPISLYLDETPARMKQIIHDISFRPAVINASKIFYDKEVRSAISKHYGPEYTNLLIPWLRDVANASNYRAEAQKVGAMWLELARQNIIATLIGFNPGTVMKHGPTAAMNSLTEVGALPFLKAVRGLLSTNEETGESNWRFALDTSEELQRRHRHYVETLRGASEEVMREPTLRETMIRLGAWPVAMSDLLSAVPTWLAKYETSTREGADHGTSVFDADRAVRRAHGSSVVTNRPGVMRGGALAQWTSSLYGFFSHILNRQFELAWKAKETLGLAKEGEYAEATSRLPELGGMLFSYVIFPALVEEAVTGQGDPREGWGVKAAKALTFSLSSSWIGLRDLVSAAIYNRDPSAGLLSTAGKTATDMVRDARRGKEMFNKQHAGQTIQHTLTFLGAATGLTNASEGRAARFIYDYWTGQARPRGWGDWWKGLRHGTLKEQNR